jgi:hypothetical protein
MTTKLKMWIGNLDGSREGLVIAPTQVRARAIIGTSRGDFDGYWRQHPIDPRLEPEVLYTRRYGVHVEAWVHESFEDTLSKAKTKTKAPKKTPKRRKKQ